MTLTNVHLCSFAGGVVRLSPKQRKDKASILAALKNDPRISTWDMSEGRPRLWRIIYEMEREGLIVEMPAEYPWHKFQLSDAGAALLEATTITITFERMPGSREEVVMIFKRAGRVVSVKAIISDIVRHGKATCHPKDEFSLEAGMRLAVKRAKCERDYYLFPRIQNGVFDRAFRRWMFLAKAAHVCREVSIPGCHQCWDCYPYHPSLCDRSRGVGLEDTPDMKIAREFGRVTVTIT